MSIVNNLIILLFTTTLFPWTQKVGLYNEVDVYLVFLFYFYVTLVKLLFFFLSSDTEWINF